MAQINFSKSSIKIIIIAVLILAFLIPLAFIGHLIKDRQTYQSEAISSIIEPFGGKAELQGIVIAVPYLVHKEFADVNGKTRIETQTKYVCFVPDDFRWIFRLILII